jgi:hypothetical protein
MERGFNRALKTLTGGGGTRSNALLVFAFLTIVGGVFFEEILDLRLAARKHVGHVAGHAARWTATAGRKAKPAEWPAAAADAEGGQAEGCGGGRAADDAAAAAEMPSVPSAASIDVVQQNESGETNGVTEVAGAIVSSPPPPPPHPLENLLHVDAMTEALSAIAGGTADAADAHTVPGTDDTVADGGTSSTADADAPHPPIPSALLAPPMTGTDDTGAAAGGGAEGGGAADASGAVDHGVVTGPPRTKPPPAGAAQV